MVDRQPAPALETSFANAGEVSPGYSAPWAGPGVPLKAIKWLADAAPAAGHPAAHRPGVHALGAGDAAQLHRGALRNQQDAAWCGWPNTAATACGPCAPRPASPTTSGCRARCSSSAPRSSSTAAPATSRCCAQRRRPSNCWTAPAASATSRRWPPCATSSSAACSCPATKPATASSSPSGWPRWPSNAASHSATARRSSASSQSAQADRPASDRRGRDCAADAYLVALGSHSPLLLRPVGMRIPVYPVKGYSITVPIVDAAGAPESTVMDETHKVAVTRLGDRIRVGGTAELAGYTLKLHEARRADAGARRERPVPAGGDRGAGRVLVRPAADDARRHAGDRRHADPPTSTSPPATARSAGRWRRAPGG